MEVFLRLLLLSRKKIEKFLFLRFLLIIISRTTPPPSPISIQFSTTKAQQNRMNFPFSVAHSKNVTWTIWTGIRWKLKAFSRFMKLQIQNFNIRGFHNSAENRRNLRRQFICQNISIKALNRIQLAPGDCSKCHMIINYAVTVTEMKFPFQNEMDGVEWKLEKLFTTILSGKTFLEWPKFDVNTFSFGLNLRLALFFECLLWGEIRCFSRYCDVFVCLWWLVLI